MSKTNSILLSSSNATSIGATMKSIRNTLAGFRFKDRKVVFENPAKTSSACAIINMYYHEDLARFDEIVAAHKADPRVRIPRLRPRERYVFYPSSFNADRLGSVAIYTDDIAACEMRIRKSGHLFGVPVSSINMEYGLRPFLDVRLRA